MARLRSARDARWLLKKPARLCQDASAQRPLTALIEVLLASSEACSLTELQLGEEFTATLPALLPICLRRLVLGRYYYAALHPSIVRSAPSLREVVAYRAFAGANILLVREWPSYVRLEMRD